MRSLLLTQLLFILALLSPPTTLAGTRLSGELREAGGRPLSVAQIFLSGLTGDPSKALVSATASSDGTFALEVPSPGLYLLWLAAPGYSPQNYPIAVEAEEKSLTLKATLAPYGYREQFEKVRIIGSWNQYKASDAESMQPQPDGTWVYERAASEEQVGYQLLGVEAKGRSIPGTQADSYTIDSAGNYQSQLKTQEGRVRIVFEPAKLLRSSKAGQGKIEFDRKHAHLLRLIRLTSEANESQQKAFAAYKDHAQQSGGTVPFQFSHGALPRTLLTTMRSSRNPLFLRQGAALLLLGLPFHEHGRKEGERSEALVMEVLKIVPPDSPLWALHASVISLIPGLVPAGTLEALLRDFVNRNPERYVHAIALGTLVRTSPPGDEVTLSARCKELEPYAKDIPFARFLQMECSAERKTVKGKPVPAFVLKLLDGDEEVSREALSGRFYLIDFWATWCGPCVADMHRLHEVWKKFEGRGGFTILSVSLDNEAEAVAKFRDGRWKMPWLNAHAAGGFGASMARDFEVSYLPRLILVDPQGVIVASDRELSQGLERTLESNLPAAEHRKDKGPSDSASRLN
jgi:thiol-disulfide isomerase/thioredoxin